MKKSHEHEFDLHSSIINREPINHKPFNGFMLAPDAEELRRKPIVEPDINPKRITVGSQHYRVEPSGELTPAYAPPDPKLPSRFLLDN